MITLADNRIESESRVVANGQPRTITQEGCSGTETAVWSADRQRVFLNAELNCGNNVKRKVSGMFAMLRNSQWASIQSIGTAGNTRLHTVRYVETDANELPQDIAQALRDNRLARETVRIGAAAPIDIADVKEAAKVAETSVVEAWLTAVAQPFDLNASTLIELADAGVPPSVIDVMVAISNPGRFAVREERASERDDRGRRRPSTCWDSYWVDPYDPFSYRAGYYGYGCRPGWGGTYYPWGGGYYGGGTVIVIDGGTGRSSGKVTRDGYKSGRPRDASSIADRSGSSSSTPARTSASPGKSSGSSSDDSSSSGSSGSGRKAKPRGGN